MLVRQLGIAIIQRQYDTWQQHITIIFANGTVAHVENASEVLAQSGTGSPQSFELWSHFALVRKWAIFKQLQITRSTVSRLFNALRSFPMAVRSSFDPCIAESLLSLDSNWLPAELVLREAASDAFIMDDNSSTTGLAPFTTSNSAVDQLLFPAIPSSISSWDRSHQGLLKPIRRVLLWRTY